MAYTIDRYNRQILTVVEDGTIDQTTDLKLVGKNYAGYGEIQNENFVYLLENFAGSTAPPKAVSGQVWFDSNQSKLKFYDGSKWRTTGGAEVLGAAPAGLTEGDFWWDTANEQLYAYNGTDFVLVGPQDAGDGITQMQSRSIRDTQGATHSIIVSIINDTVVHIVSNDTAFTIDSTDAENRIPGFDIVKKGITLVNTLASTNGVTGTDHIIWGTASAAKGLVVGGTLVDATNFIQAGNASFATLAEFSDLGLAIGDSNDFKITIQNDNEAVLSNEVGKTIIFKTKTEQGVLKNPVIIKSNSIEPGLQSDNVTTETVTLGLVTKPFNNVYATNFTGLSEKASTLVVNGNNRSGDVAATANSVAVRDASGDLRANLFRGTALTAKFADLAEKYSTAEELSPGTVVTVCNHEDHDVEAAKIGDIAIGVVSTDPALMMNSSADGQYIGLKGRLPVRVIGAVKKGQAVYVDNNGCASTIYTGGSMVGIALESNATESEKLIECVLKV
tara:strand:- start:13891 stop:15396 length:1506 start_codon:yes stop_codon:yes gene_type:complete